jgi:hypothetical protein
MGRWLAVREEWDEVRYGNSGKSGGYVVGYLVTRVALGWLDAPNKSAARLAAPFGTTAVLSFLSLDVEDRDGWLKMEVGRPTVSKVPLFEGGAARTHFENAKPRPIEQLELAA